MKIIFSLFITLFTLSSFVVSGQSVKFKSGDLKALKGIKSIKVEYDYSNMAAGKYKDEKEYVKNRTAELNAKEAGKGDTWAKKWEEDRTERFEPKFEELFTKYSDIKLSDRSTEKYTLIFRTTFTEIGFNVGVMKKPAYIDAVIVIVETANPKNEIAVINIKKSPGSSFWDNDYDTGVRIQEAYAKAGKSLGKFMKDETE